MHWKDTKIWLQTRLWERNTRQCKVVNLSRVGHLCHLAISVERGTNDCDAMNGQVRKTPKLTVAAVCYPMLSDGQGIGRLGKHLSFPTTCVINKRITIVGGTCSRSWSFQCNRHFTVLLCLLCWRNLMTSNYRCCVVCTHVVFCCGHT